MSVISDEELMWRVCQGQTAQLGVLFERYHIRLFNFFVRTLQDRELSEDLTQNVFLRVLKYKHSYKENAPFKAWFYQIARNVRADHFKKQKINTIELDNTHIERNLGLSSEDLDLEKKEKLLMLQQALNRLPEDKRELLVLTQLEEMEYKEIAQTFQITENSARVKVHRALKQLKEIFEKKYNH